MSDAKQQERTMNLYDFNQIIMAQIPPLNNEAIQKAIYQINSFKKPDKKYYMLLCRELNYYTVFVVQDSAKEDFGSVVIDCAQKAGNGELISVDLTEDKNAIEIWINVTYPSPDDEKTVVTTAKCMYLFNYDTGICVVK